MRIKALSELSDLRDSYQHSGYLFPLTSFNSGNTIDANDTANGAGQHAFVELATNDGNTDYSALELNLQRQLNHRLMYNVSYTWSHNMADFVDNLTGGDHRRMLTLCATK